jgi:hypothetical protein
MYALNCCVFMISFLLFTVFLLILCKGLPLCFELITYCSLALIHDEFHIQSDLCG